MKIYDDLYNYFFNIIYNKKEVSKQIYFIIYLL